MNSAFFRIVKFFIIFASTELYIMPTCWAHQGINHSQPDSHIVKELPKEKLPSLNSSYEIATKKLLLRACGDCHSRFTKMPWYSELPLISSIIAADITEAKKHLDLSDGFPFKGHGSPEEDLRAIDKVIRNKTMPPISYRVIHQSEQLSLTEITIIREWLAAALLQLENSNTKADLHVAPE